MSQNPVITSITIEPSANCVAVQEVTINSGIAVNGVTNAPLSRQIPQNCKPNGAGINIGGRMSGTTAAYVFVSGPTGPGQRGLWYYPGPGSNGGLAWTIMSSGPGIPETQVWQGDVGSGNFNLTVNKDGSVALAQV